MPTFRMKRVNTLVKRELSQLVREHLPVENYGLISITEVEVAKDLKNASVYVSVIGIEPQQQKDAVLAMLERLRSLLQHELSRKVILKYTPHLLFKWDEGIERGQHVVEILEDLEQK